MINALAQNDGALYVRCVGNTHSTHAPLVLLHGWGSDSSCWSPLLSLLEKDYLIYLVDLPGFGGSADIALPPLEGLFALLEQALLQQCLPAKAHWLGWSLGGMLASAFAARFPERCASLCTISSNAKFVADANWPQACAATTYRAFLQGFASDAPATLKRFVVLQGQGDDHRKKITRYLSDNMPQLSEQNVAAWKQALGLLNLIDNRQALIEATVQHLAIFGENDALVPAAVANDMSQANMCDSVRVIKGAGHAPHLSQPELVAEALHTFIQAHEYPFGRDKQRVAHSFSAAAGSYEKAAALQARVAKKLVALQNNLGGTLCDIGCGTGFCIDEIRPHNSEVIGLDIAPGMLNYCREKNQLTPVNLVCADFENLPLKAGSVDGIVSSMSVQWSENLPALFQQFRGALNVQGWLLFSTLGPQTLHELRSAWHAVDDYVHVNQFASMADVRHALLGAGFEIAQCHAENEVLHYENAMSLMRDLKAIGAHNVNAGTYQGLSTRKHFQQMADAYETFRGNGGCNGKLPATYEVFYCLARAK